MMMLEYAGIKLVGSIFSLETLELISMVEKVLQLLIFLLLKAQNKRTNTYYQQTAAATVGEEERGYSNT